MKQRQHDTQPAKRRDPAATRETQQETEESFAPFDAQRAGALDWQRMVGNQGLQRLLAGPSTGSTGEAGAADHGPAAVRRMPASLKLLQTRLTVGEADDAYEQEADEVAQQVMRMEAPPGLPDDGDEDNNRAVIAQRRIQRLPRYDDSAAPQPAQAATSIHAAGTGQVQRLHARGLVSDELREIIRTLRRVERQIEPMEREPVITTEEADQLRANITAMREDAERLAERRETTRADARRIWLRGRRLLRLVRRMASLRRDMRRRASQGRSTEGNRLLSEFQVTPRTIHVSEGESTRISFIVRGTNIRSISGYILSRERSEGTSYRFFTWNNPAPGYKEAIWDGTFEGSRASPPETGTYRVRIAVSDDAGSEEAYDYIRVENPDEDTVLPRTQSGLKLQSLTFDGHEAVLTDERGNEIRARALSGLRPNNPHNRTHRDYTGPEHQWVRGRGPIPEGTYTINRHSVQQPEVRGRRLAFPTGGSASAWGPNRIPLYPQQVRNRSQFFVHLDVASDGTAGCIGIQPSDIGKFNQMMSLIMWMTNDSLPVHVHYGS